MINSVIFDLDGVLVNTKIIHFKALNRALKDVNPNYVINFEEHLKIYDGLPTKKKLKLLNEFKDLPSEKFDLIKSKKDSYTRDLLYENIKFSKNIYDIFFELKKRGFKTAIATNAIQETLDICIDILNIRDFLDFSISNKNIVQSKPKSEIYLRAFIELNIDPNEAIIIEDSPHGKISAINSGGNLLPLDDMLSLNLELILNKIDNLNYNKDTKMTQNYWYSDNLNILIPMAGKGSRFSEAGYTFPKPLIEINQKPMIQVVVENLGLKANYIFLVLKEHYEKFNLKYFLNNISEGCKIIVVDEVTEGAACTSLLAKEHINNDDMLVIANSDQYIHWNPSETMYSFINNEDDGGILCFNSTHPKWSYAKINNQGYVEEVAEKKVISDLATVGIYYWRKGRDYVKYAEQMIEKDIRVNNEFYICPVFNEAIKDNKKISTKIINEMYGLGTPEDLKYFLDKKK